jgi:hypothetical protein
MFDADVPEKNLKVEDPGKVPISYLIKSSLIRLGEYLLMIGIAAAILYFVFKNIIGSSKEIYKPDPKIAIVESKIDTIAANQKHFIEDFFVLENKIAADNQRFLNNINQNNDSIKKNLKELSNNKKLYNEKVTALDSYNFHQLDSFFSARYGKIK